MEDYDNCNYCKITTKVCYWGERVEYRAWRRYVLFIIAIIMAVFSLVMSVLLLIPPYKQVESLFLLLITIPMVAFSVLGIMVTIKGCEHCVNRMWGGGFF